MESDKLLRQKAYRKILDFFYDNPAAIDTGRGIATWTGLDIKSVRKALKKLSEMGILESHKTVSTTAYSFTADKRKSHQVKKLLGR